MSFKFSLQLQPEVEVEPKSSTSHSNSVADAQSKDNIKPSQNEIIQELPTKSPSNELTSTSELTSTVRAYIKDLLSSTNDRPTSNFIVSTNGTSTTSAVTEPSNQALFQVQPNAQQAPLQSPLSPVIETIDKSVLSNDAQSSLERDQIKRDHDVVGSKISSDSDNTAAASVAKSDSTEESVPSLGSKPTIPALDFLKPAKVTWKRENLENDENSITAPLSNIREYHSGGADFPSDIVGIAAPTPLSNWKAPVSSQAWDRSATRKYQNEFPQSRYFVDDHREGTAPHTSVFVYPKFECRKSDLGTIHDDTDYGFVMNEKQFLRRQEAEREALLHEKEMLQKVNILKVPVLNSEEKELLAEEGIRSSNILPTSANKDHDKQGLVFIKKQSAYDKNSTSNANSSVHNNTFFTGCGPGEFLTGLGNAMGFGGSMRRTQLYQSTIPGEKRESDVVAFVNPLLLESGGQSEDSISNVEDGGTAKRRNFAKRCCLLALLVVMAATGSILLKTCFFRNSDPEDSIHSDSEDQVVSSPNTKFLIGLDENLEDAENIDENNEQMCCGIIWGSVIVAAGSIAGAVVGIVCCCNDDDSSTDSNDTRDGEDQDDEEEGDGDDEEAEDVSWEDIANPEESQFSGEMIEKISARIKENEEYIAQNKGDPRFRSRCEFKALLNENMIPVIANAKAWNSVQESDYKHDIKSRADLRMQRITKELLEETKAHSWSAAVRNAALKGIREEILQIVASIESKEEKDLSTDDLLNYVACLFKAKSYAHLGLAEQEGVYWREINKKWSHIRKYFGPQAAEREFWLRQQKDLSDVISKLDGNIGGGSSDGSSDDSSDGSNDDGDYPDSPRLKDAKKANYNDSAITSILNNGNYPNNDGNDPDSLRVKEQLDAKKSELARVAETLTKLISDPIDSDTHPKSTDNSIGNNYVKPPGLITPGSAEERDVKPYYWWQYYIVTDQMRKIFEKRPDLAAKFNTFPRDLVEAAHLAGSKNDREELKRLMRSNPEYLHFAWECAVFDDSVGEELLSNPEGLAFFEELGLHDKIVELKAKLASRDLPHSTGFKPRFNHKRGFKPGLSRLPATYRVDTSVKPLEPIKPGTVEVVVGPGPVVAGQLGLIRDSRSSAVDRNIAAAPNSSRSASSKSDSDTSDDKLAVAAGRIGAGTGNTFVELTAQCEDLRRKQRTLTEAIDELEGHIEGDGSFDSFEKRGMEEQLEAKEAERARVEDALRTNEEALKLTQKSILKIRSDENSSSQDEKRVVSASTSGASAVAVDSALTGENTDSRKQKQKFRCSPPGSQSANSTSKHSSETPPIEAKASTVVASGVDDEAERIYTRALEKGVPVERRCRILIVGEQGSGKTAMMQRLRGMPWHEQDGGQVEIGMKEIRSDEEEAFAADGEAVDLGGGPQVPVTSDGKEMQILDGIGSDEEEADTESMEEVD